MITYLFNQPGSIPGIPGTFAGVRVDVAEDGTFQVLSLPQVPHIIEATATTNVSTALPEIPSVLPPAALSQQEEPIAPIVTTEQEETAPASEQLASSPEHFSFEG